MNLARIIQLLLSLAVFTLVGCATETLIEDRYSLDYLKAKPGKTLVYPAGVEEPEQSLDYAIPDPPANAARQEYDVNQVIKPPRIVPLPKEDEDDEDED